MLLERHLDDGRVDAFRRSRLTLTGCPLEPAFSSLSLAPRYTIEPATPDMHPAQALNHVLALLARLHCALPEAGLLRRLADLQQMGALRFGAHVGVRHGSSGDAYKLYAELPEAAASQAEALGRDMLGNGPVLDIPGRAARPVLIGINLTSGELEIYYRIDNLHPQEIGTLMARGQLEPRAEEVRAIVSASQPVALRHEMPGRTWGFSYCRAAQAAPVFSLYTFARTLFGPDGWVRTGVLALARSFDWDLGIYPQLSQPLAGSRAFPGLHGIFGIVVRPDGAPGAWIGLAPAEAST